MKEEIISCDRVLLRKADINRIRELHSKGTLDEVRLFYGFDSIDKAAVEQLKFEKGLITFNKSFLYFHILAKDDQRVIGWCGYHTWYLEHDRAEMGYGLFEEDLKRKGLMTEVMRTVLAYGFQELNLHRIEALIGKENIPSIRLVEKFGFEKEGVLRGHYKVNGVNEDSEIYSLLKSEFTANGTR